MDERRFEARGHTTSLSAPCPQRQEFTFGEKSFQAVFLDAFVRTLSRAIQPPLNLHHRHHVLRHWFAHLHLDARKPANGFCPTILLEDLKPQRSCLEQRVRDDFDGVLHAAAVDNRDLAVSQRHAREDSRFAVCSPTWLRPNVDRPSHKCRGIQILKRALPNAIRWVIHMSSTHHVILTATRRDLSSSP